MLFGHIGDSVDSLIGIDDSNKDIPLNIKLVKYRTGVNVMT